MKRVFAFIGFTAAVTLIVLNTVGLPAVKYIMIFAAVSLVISLLVKDLRQGKALPVALGSMLFACLIFVICMQSSVLPQKELDGKTAEVSFKITDIETQTDSGYLYTVKTDCISLPDSPQNIKLKLKTSEKINADYYENVTAELAFYSFADSGFDSFGDYGDNIFIRASLIGNTQTYDSGSPVKPLNYYIIQLRLKIKDILTENLSEEKAGLALSIFTGDKRLLYDDINNSFKACGISHMTAVSGLHISVICLCVYYLLKFLKTPPLPRTFATLGVLLVYSGIADYSKSVLRAGIMITVMLIAKLVSNKADTLNSLGFAVFIICLNPFAVTDASAVLTVSAVIGLTVLKPSYDRLLRPKNRLLRYLYDGLFIGVSVLLATLPAMWLFFGRVSLMSLILNIIGVPILELALVSLLLLCILSGIPVLAFIPKQISSFSLGALIAIADFSQEHFEFLYLNISDSLFGVTLAGIFLFLGISFLISGKINIKPVSVLLAAIFAVTTVFSVYNYSRNIYLTVSDSGAVIIYDRDCVVLIDADSDIDCYTLENIVGTKRYGISAAVDCTDCKSGIEKILPDTVFVSRGEDMPELCEHIGLEYSDGILTAVLYDKVFKIYDGYVTINGYRAYRDIYDRFSESKDVTFTAAPNSQVQIKEGQ